MSNWKQCETQFSPFFSSTILIYSSHWATWCESEVWVWVPACGFHRPFCWTWTWQVASKAVLRLVELQNTVPQERQRYRGNFCFLHVVTPWHW